MELTDRTVGTASPVVVGECSFTSKLCPHTALRHSRDIASGPTTVEVDKATHLGHCFTCMHTFIGAGEGNSYDSKISYHDRAGLSNYGTLHA